MHPVPGSTSFIAPAVADYDNDGKPDLPWAQNLGNWNFRYESAIDDLIQGAGYGADMRQNLRLQQSLPSAPQDVRSVNGWVPFHGVLSLDYDDDGKEDFLAGPYDQPGTPILLFHNLGNWQFEFSRQDFFRNLLGWTESTTWQSETFLWGDFDADGVNDLFLTHNTYKEPYQSIFLHNTGTAFLEEAIPRGIGVPNYPIDLRPEGAALADINGDGNLDLYVAHNLFINDGTGHFTDARADYGLPVTFDEGAAFVDYNNDGLLDLYLRSFDPTMLLFRNTGSGYVNASVSSGLACLMEDLPYYEGDAWADFNSDGNLDLLVTIGEPGLAPEPQYVLFLNQGDGTFRLGYLGNRFIILPATADLDNDGDMDIAALNSQVDENILTPPTGTRFLLVDPIDANGRESEMGAIVHLVNPCTGYIQTRVAGTNSVYLAHGEYAPHFAVPYGCDYRIEVTFPKKGIQPQETLVIPYDPSTEGSLKIAVMRSGYSKHDYGIINKYFFPNIQKDQ